jgi:hypothetical protein
MPDLDILTDRLRSLLAEATPGPWAMEHSPPRLFRVVSGLDRLGSVVSSAMWSSTDAALIAESRNALPALLDVVAARGAHALAPGDYPPLGALDAFVWRKRAAKVAASLDSMARHHMDEVMALLAERDALAAAMAPDEAMRVHLRHCAACAGPNDGCDLGQELEERCHRGGWDAPARPSARRWCPECQREVMPEDVGKPACPGCGVA